MQRPWGRRRFGIFVELFCSFWLVSDPDMTDLCPGNSVFLGPTNTLPGYFALNPLVGWLVGFQRFIYLRERGREHE